ncbi:MAG: LAGLIDADG family homing endonuclease, partial [Acidimicrobiia bacterium]
MNTHPEQLWYFVGLITSDGCLCGDGSHVSLTSKDYSFLKDLRNTLRIRNRIGTKIGGSGSVSFQIQMGNKAFHRFLQRVGLTPDKSLTLGSPVFASWLKLSTEAFFGVCGRVRVRKGKGNRHPVYI